jgi:hypothetical protein
MPADGATSFDMIEATWFTLRDSFDDALQAAETKEERERLLTERDGAYRAYVSSLGKVFDEQDQFIQKTKKELKGALADMKRELASLQDIAAILAVVASAVKLAAALAGMRSAR